MDLLTLTRLWPPFSEGGAAHATVVWRTGRAGARDALRGAAGSQTALTGLPSANHARRATAGGKP